MGRTGKILLALASGILMGLILRAADNPILLAFGTSLRPLGQIWLHALQMTIVPLVFCLMAGGIGAVTRMAGSGRVIGFTLVLLAVLLLLASLIGVAMAYGLMAVWPVATSGRVFLEGASALPATPSIVDQLLDFIPLNPVAAAAQSAMTPLIVFAAIFGAAATRIEADVGKALFRLLKAVAQTMLVIVHWVLAAAPFGVFFLGLDAVLRVGLGFAASLVQLVLMLSVALVIGITIIMLVGALGSGVGIVRFARAAFAPQALAASTQSSMACLPALMRAAQVDLKLPPSLVAAVMPLAISTFRFGNVLGGITSGLIGAYICGIHPSAGQIMLAVTIGMLTNVGVIGLPGQAVLIVAYGPVFAALGTPLAVLTLLIAVFTLPDILDTTANVTGDLAATAIIARLFRRTKVAEDVEMKSTATALEV